MNKTIKDLLKSDKYNNFVVGEDNSIFPLQKKNGAEEVEKTPNSYYENEKKQLTHLNLSGNKIHSLHFLIDAENKDLFADLEYLNLSNNLIRNLCWYPNLEKDGGETSFFTDLPKLKTLDLSRNDIRQGYDCLNNLKECKCTLSEDLSNKHIKNIEFVARATNRGKIALEKNLFLQEMPYFREQKDKNEPLKERLAKYFEDFKKVDTKDFPVKIMFLGNHAAGKSTYRANVLKVGEVDGSTHILNVSEYKYETDTENNDYENIKAFIYDFGGQDYYHGIYRAFFTNDALNLLFWCKKTNENKEDFDSNDQDKPEAERKKIRNYNLENWLTQLKYSYSKDRENWNDKNPILIFQTHADEVEYKKTVQFLNPNFKLDEYQVVNDFFVSLNQETVEDKLQELAYSKNFLDKIIDEVKAKEDIAAESKIKVLYEAINKFDEKQQKEIPVKKSELKSKVTDENLDDILHRGKNRGLILHYPNHPTIQDKIWLKPENLVKYIHGHICTKCLINNGIFKYAAIKTDACNKTTEERNKISCDKNCKLHFDSTILELLEAEKVIFKNKGENGVEYIIPSYLPLAKKDKNFELQKFGFANPNFTLKFLYFIPFGLINQLICYFGNLPDIKRYWRDNVIFTFLGRFKVWIELNFEELTISAYIVEDTNAKIEEKTYSKRVQDDIAVYLTKIKNEVAPETQEETDKELDKEKETEECSNTQENEQVQEIPEKISKSDVEQFIFYKIWELYWSFKENDNQFPQLKNDNPTTEEQNEKFYNFIKYVPYDMYLSVDNKWFVKYETIHKLEKSQLTEIATNFENCEKTGGYKQKELRLSNFKNYTFNKHIFGMKKILISYSRKDVGYKNLLRDRLSILQKFNIAETWACEDLTDSLWDEKIQKELNDSHLVIFMLSPNFFASEYIVDKEVIPVLKKFSERKQKIMCVKVSEFGAETEINKFFEDKKLNYITSDFQYFPYGTIDDRSTGQVKEQIVPLDQYRQMCGYGSIEPALKQIVDKIIEALK